MLAQQRYRNVRFAGTRKLSDEVKFQLWREALAIVPTARSNWGAEGPPADFCLFWTLDYYCNDPHADKRPALEELAKKYRARIKYEEFKLTTTSFVRRHYR